MSRQLRALALTVGCSFLLAACAQPITLNYTPQTTAEIKSTVGVNSFKYFKAHASDDNEIGCSKLNCPHLTETVSDYVTNAVKREFRQAGMSIANANCTLNGEINEYSITPNFFSVTYKTDIRYILNSGSGKSVFDNDYTVEFDAAGTYNITLAINNINKSLGDNIDKLLNDRDFINSVRKNCQ